MPEQQEAVLPPRFPFPAMRAVLNDVFGVTPESLRLYREALALDEQGWECAFCDAPLAPYTLCAKAACIVHRLNAKLRAETLTC